MALFLGVDGGGSKTEFVLVDGDGRLRARVRGGSSYYFGEGLDLVRRVLADGVARVTAEAGIAAADIDRAFFGLPGYGEVSADVAALDALPREVLGHARSSSDNDMVCGWAGSLGAADGINVISGTGSMTYGERLGRGHRVGGWSELFGDEGSGYWVAIRGLNAFTRMSDGRLPRGPLHELMRARTGVRSDLDLIDVVMNDWKGRRTDIADLSTTVVAAAAHGDAVAEGILADAGRELVDVVRATRAHLGFAADEVVPVSYSGGMFSAEPILRGFRAMLAAEPAPFDLRRPMLDPGIGAALYAAKAAGTPLSASALDALRTGASSTPASPAPVP
jgi:N-acetylglucosamine kinase-like BadF-type ATPase